MHLVFLGTASCYPTKNRGVSCTAVKFDDGDIWLFDCGEGSQIQVQKSCLHFVAIKKIFITHLHGDHLFGLPGLLCSLGNVERNEEFLLEIFGPLGLRRYIRESLNLSRSPLKYKYTVHELIPTKSQYPEDLNEWKINEEADSLLHPQELLGKQIQNIENNWELLSDEHGTVKAGALVHRIPTFGYVIKEPNTPGTLDAALLQSKGLKPGPLFGKLKRGESITLNNGMIIHPSDVLGPPIPGCCLTILGDTKDSSGMTSIAMNSDVVLHEATLEDSLKEKALENGHSTPTMAVDFAHSIKAKNLVLFHFSQRYKLDEEPSLNTLSGEAEKSIDALNFNCKIFVAHDLMELHVVKNRVTQSITLTQVN